MRPEEDARLGQSRAACREICRADEGDTPPILLLADVELGVKVIAHQEAMPPCAREEHRRRARSGERRRPSNDDELRPLATGVSNNCGEPLMLGFGNPRAHEADPKRRCAEKGSQKRAEQVAPHRLGSREPRRAGPKDRLASAVGAPYAVSGRHRT
jgi:hypothetical protein